jgi:hypothetical protein
VSKLSDDIFLNSSSDGAQKKGPEIRQWFPSDTQENWDHNVKHNLKKLQESGWIKSGTKDEPKEILYRINKNGYRNDHIIPTRIDHKCAFFLGCSNMFGVGIHEKHTIPYQFQQSLDQTHNTLTCINFGQPGGSLDACVRTAMAWAPLLRPKLICLLLPPGLRRELWKPPSINDDMIDEGNAWLQYGVRSNIATNYHQLVEEIFITPQEEMVNTAKNLWALKGLSLNHNARFLVASAYQVPESISMETAGKARDLKHFSAKWHEHLYQYFFTQYTENNTSYIPHI